MNINDAITWGDLLVILVIAVLILLVLYLVRR